MSSAPTATSAPRERAWAKLIGEAGAFAARRPLACAVLFVAALMLMAILVFRPRYDTNDDAMMSLIVAGKGVLSQPDEHMVFTHFLLGGVLKFLYTVAPAVPWYGSYLLAVHGCAHVALVYLLFKERVGWRWLLVYLAYAATIGLMLLCALQFTTTAFLAAQSGILLGWFAFVRAADGDVALARRSGIAAAIFILTAALIRWHVFLLFLSLALPTAGVLVWVYRSRRRLLLRASLLTALLIAGVGGVSKLNDVYYRHDPNWRDFYWYNELRARINDLGWVYYSPETAHVFPKVGWSVNDFGMILSWFYDDPTVYNAGKFQDLLDAYPWKQSRAEVSLAGLFDSLAHDTQVVAMVLLLPLLVYGLRRNPSAQAALLLSCLWAVGILCAATVVRKPPPPRIYLPVLSFPAALALFLAAAARPRASGILNVSHLACGAWRGLGSTWGRSAVQTASIVCAAFGVVSCVAEQFDRSAKAISQRETFYRELAALNTRPDKLFICWGACFPFELLDPLDNLQHLNRMRMVQFGWMQQCPFHAEMKRRFGVDDFARQLPDRPDITLICDPACLTLMSTYIREHHHREVQFERVGSFVNAALARVSTATPSMASEEQRRRD